MPMEDTRSCGNSEERAFQGRGVKALWVKMWRDSVGSWKNSAGRDGWCLLEGTRYSSGFFGKWISKQDCPHRRLIEGDAVKDKEEDLRRADWALHQLAGRILFDIICPWINVFRKWKEAMARSVFMNVAIFREVGENSMEILKYEEVKGRQKIVKSDYFSLNLILSTICFHLRCF